MPAQSLLEAPEATQGQGQEPGPAPGWRPGPGPQPGPRRTPGPVLHPHRQKLNPWRAPKDGINMRILQRMISGIFPGIRPGC